MNKFELMNGVTRTLGRVGLKLKKHSPEILVIAGTVGAVTSAVLACKATTKINPILEEAKYKVDTIHEAVERGTVVADQNGELVEVSYSAEDSKKDLAIVYTQTCLDFIKLYGPAVALGLTSIGCILASNNIMRKRNVALAAAYATVDSGFKEYRGRVIERFGKELDRELRYNIKAQEIEETIVNEDGSEQTVTKTVQVGEVNQNSMYARFYDDGCKGWEKDPEMNLYFLHQVQNWANDKLKAQGYLILNDVYEALGIPKCKAGYEVGWVYDEEHPIGDNYVDFGIYNDIHSKPKRNFVNGYERVILLDFNVDGYILNHI